jgi:AcrR family transcriptional regulator
MLRPSPLVLDASAALPIGHPGESDNRVDRLVAVAAEQIASRGMAEVSARSIAAGAAASPSAINYNFGGIEHLFSRAFDSGAALTADWLEPRHQALLALPRTAEGAVRALEHLLVAWTREARPLALLYQEHLAATPAQAGWTGLWRDSWLRIAEVFGLSPAQGRLMHLFFESEALYHLSRWSPALEDAALRELVDHFGAVWLGARPVPPIGALALAEQTARARPDAANATAQKIMAAAAEVVEQGLGALTHRSVAARAGLTTGAVTHHFRTTEELVAGAIRGQVLAMSRVVDGETVSPLDPVSTPEAFFAGARLHSLPDPGGAGPAAGRRTLFLAAVRRPELAGAGAVIRFAHGGTARSSLGGAFEIAPELISLYAGLVSRLLSALPQACAADAAPREAREQLLETIEQGLVGRLPPRTGGAARA